MINETLNKITDLLAFHKPELIANINALGYMLADTSDQTIVIFILSNITIDNNLENMIIAMLDKYETKSNACGEQTSNAGGTMDKIKKISKYGLYAGIALAVIGTVVAYYFINKK